MCTSACPSCAISGIGAEQLLCCAGGGVTWLSRERCVATWREGITNRSWPRSLRRAHALMLLELGRRTGSGLAMECVFDRAPAGSGVPLAGGSCTRSVECEALTATTAAATVATRVEPASRVAELKRFWQRERLPVVPAFPLRGGSSTIGHRLEVGAATPQAAARTLLHEHAGEHATAGAGPHAQGPSGCCDQS